MSKYGVISGANTGKYGPEITPHLDRFRAVVAQKPWRNKKKMKIIFPESYSAIIVC